MENADLQECPDAAVLAIVCGGKFAGVPSVTWLDDADIEAVRGEALSINFKRRCAWVLKVRRRAKAKRRGPARNSRLIR